MVSQPRTPQPFLSSWKDIASYLGKSVRSVQRYERELGLPVRRPVGKLRGAVIATKVEIDAWVEASPLRCSFQLVRPMSATQALAAMTIKDNIIRMKRLCEEMGEVRAELIQQRIQIRESISDLRRSIEEEGREISQQRSDPSWLKAVRYEGGGNGTKSASRSTH